MSNPPIDAVGEIHQSQTANLGASDLGNQGKKQLPSGGKALILLILFMFLCIFGLIIYQSITRHEPKEKVQKARNIEKFIPDMSLPVIERPAEEVTAPQDPDIDLSMMLADMSRQTYTEPASPYIAPTATPVDTLIQRRLSSPLNGNNALAPRPAPTQKTSTTFGNEGSDTLSSKLTPTKLEGSRATTLQGRNFLITQGSKIPCTLENKLISTHPGIITCIISRNIYSTNGRVILLEKGSKVVGSYESDIKQGQARIFALWSRVETPKGVIIALNSPGAGPLGEGGLHGWVDNHYAERFGGAILISLTSDFGQWAAAQSNNNGDNSVSFNNTSSGAEAAVTEVLRNSLNIPPTLYKNQGDRIMISVARDMDFSDVYHLRRK